MCLAVGSNAVAGPMDIEDDLIYAIRSHIWRHARSNQTAIGPSGLGTPCDRKLGHRLAGTPQIDSADDAPWRPTVGTAVHTWLHEAMDAANAAEEHRIGPKGYCQEPWCGYRVKGKTAHLDRWLMETNEAVGTINGELIRGTIDVYDRLTETVVDWKVPGPTAIKKYRKASDPGQEYRVQIHTYARGLVHSRGLPVKTVGIMFLPMNGELKDHYYWQEPYDPRIAAKAFNRARKIKTQLDITGPATFAQLDVEEDHCNRCPWFSPGAHDLEISCPGHPDIYAADRGDAFHDLLPS